MPLDLPKPPPRPRNQTHVELLLVVAIILFPFMVGMFVAGKMFAFSICLFAAAVWVLIAMMVI